MNNKSYLTFSLNDVLYGLETNLVQEIFLLPELTPIAEAPIDIVGLLNWHKTVIPVMHLDLRLGNAFQPCQLSDSVVVVQWENFQIGIIVNTVNEVITIDSAVRETELNYGRERDINSAFISKVAKIEDNLIILLNHETLIRQPDAIETLITDTTHELINEKDRNFYSLCHPHITPVEKAIFRSRTDNLKQVSVEENLNVTEQIPLAIISINNEYFGIELNLVREFTNIRNLTPIPCCPQHIVGYMNLRGEIVTLIDIRTALNLPMASVKSGSKVVVIDIDDAIAGIPVEEVFDVMYMHPQNIKPLPIAQSQDYLRGIVSYEEKFLSLLDLPKLMKQKELVVNEEV